VVTVVTMEMKESDNYLIMEERRKIETNRAESNGSNPLG
jgi:hypothetical protein